MKVGVIDPSLFTLPYDRHLCAGLQAIGVDVTLCGRALRTDESAPAGAYPFAARCYRWTERGKRPRSGGLHAWLKAGEHALSRARFGAWLHAHFDVLHFQWSPLPAVDVAMWRRLARDRVVLFTVHDTTPFLGRPTSRWQALGWDRLLEVAHGLVVHTEASRRTLVERGIAAQRITVIPHGPLHPMGAACSPPPAESARSTEGRRTLLVFGEIKPYKGIDVLLQALRRLPPAVARGWRLVIAGRPRCDITELQRAAVASPVPVDWRLGFLPEAELAPLFTAADVAVFPYRHVDASGALMLTLPFGVPVVASRVGIFGELLEDDLTALLVEPGDPARLAAALERVMADAALRERLRCNIRARVECAWSWTAIAEQHRACYRRLLRAVPNGREEAGSRDAVGEVRGDAVARAARGR